MDKQNIILIFVVLGLVTAGLTYHALTIPRFVDTGGWKDSLSEQPVITVSGQGKITVMPDKAHILFRVATQGKTGVEAQTKNTEASNSVIRALKARGLTEKQIETVEFRIQRIELYKEGWIDPEPAYFEAVHVLKITTKELEDVGVLLDTGVSAGANSVDTILFTLSDEREEEVKREVLENAAENAREKAETLASGLDVSLGKIVSVSEQNVGFTPVYYSTEAFKAPRDGAPDIRPENVQLSASVTVKYEIER